MFDPAPQVVSVPTVVNPIADLLRRAKALIADEAKWTTYVLRDSKGRMCVRGALIEAAFHPRWEATHYLVAGFKPANEDWGAGFPNGAAFIMAEEKLGAAAVEGTVHPPAIRYAIMLNNTMGHAATMRMIDRAIELAESAA